MKIMFITSSSALDDYLNENFELSIEKYDTILSKLKKFGFTSLYGISENSDIFFEAIFNSEILQKKWAAENSIKITYDWKKEILISQVDYIKPDVIYTNSTDIIKYELKKKFAFVKIFALWSGSPLPKSLDLKNVDVGLSFNLGYLRKMKSLNVRNIEYNSFYMHDQMSEIPGFETKEKGIDILFIGRHSSMFKNRAKLIKRLNLYYKEKLKLEFYLWDQSTNSTYNKNISNFYSGRGMFFGEMINKMFNSKIILNIHSDSTGVHKGNMRVFETLASKSFLLTDSGIYPQYLVDNEDYVSYKNFKELKSKINYYIYNDTDREVIASNGFSKLQKYYSVEIGSKNLINVFSKYL